MQKIYENKDYYINVNSVSGKVVDGNNKGQFKARLAELVEVPDYQANALREAGKIPQDYRFIRCSGKVVQAACESAWNKALAEYRVNQKNEKEDFYAKFPGLKEIRDALNADEQYRHAFNAAMEDEHNDGVNMPVSPDVSAEDLMAKYPLAALYNQADSYSSASNGHKSAAGYNAKKVLVEKGENGMAEAYEIMNNWLPESAIWN